MTDYKKVFLDTSPIIYYLEKNALYLEPIKKILTTCIQDGIYVMTSAITIEEYLVYPYNSGKMELVDNFKRFLQYMNIKIVSIDPEIAEQAAKIRGRYKTFKAMDALQIAAALISGCDLFLTNDKQLRQFRDIKCITVDEWE